jgi:predicted nucleotidyltransferase
MGEQHQTEINDIIDGILSSVPATEIYLFGSFAQGTEQADSDFDFYVVIPDNFEMREIEATWAISRGLRGKRKRGIDMLVGKQSKFDRRKNYLYSIENEVKETGVRLYG